MSKRIALVHAVKPAMQPIADAFRELWPEADCANILDDSLSRDRQKTAELTPAMYARFDALGVYAADIGADGLLFTCSAFGDAIDAVARKASFPVLKPNEAMFEAALEAGAENVETGAEEHEVLTSVDGFAAVRDALEKKLDRKSTRLNSSHVRTSRMPSSA